jgi:alpha-L-fucosidase
MVLFCKSHEVMVTKKDNNVYIHFNKPVTGIGFKLKPLDKLPAEAVLLNNGKKVECVVNLLPSDHLEQKAYLRLRNLPANELANSVMVVKLKFS